MIKASVEDMLSGKESRYALVMGVAKRAREINAQEVAPGISIGQVIGAHY